jgi:hypothetical protein
MNALTTIQTLSNERQRLWWTAGRKKLTADQRERLRHISRQVEQLWNEHRCEVALPYELDTDDEDRYSTPAERLKQAEAGASFQAALTVAQKAEMTRWTEAWKWGANYEPGGIGICCSTTERKALAHIEAFYWRRKHDADNQEQPEPEKMAV